MIFGARFVPGGRTVATLTAGLVRMQWVRFAAFAGVAGVAWASYAAFVGYLGGRTFENDPLWGLLTGFGVAAGVLIVVEGARRTRNRSRRLAAKPAPCVTPSC